MLSPAMPRCPHNLPRATQAVPPLLPQQQDSSRARLPAPPSAHGETQAESMAEEMCWVKPWRSHRHQASSPAQPHTVPTPAFRESWRVRLRYHGEARPISVSPEVRGLSWGRPPPGHTKLCLRALPLAMPGRTRALGQGRGGVGPQAPQPAPFIPTTGD